MNRRTFLTVSALLAAGRSASAGSKTGRTARPNIVHIVPHDLGTDLACYGIPTLLTPNLDQLAREGVRFTRYFTQSTACSPSRGAAMTGRYAHTNGLIGLVNVGWALPENEQTIIDYLGEAGYETIHAGLQHFRERRADNRFETNLGEDNHDNREAAWCDRAISHAVSYLEKRDDKRPFYLNLPFFEVHSPWDKRPEYKQNHTYDPADIVLPAHLNDAGGVRQTMCDYYSSITFMDKWVGHLLATLKRLGLEENTLVVFTTDHGRAFPRAKGTLYDPGMRIAFIMRWPAGIKAGWTTDELISSIDLCPTLIDIAGGDIPACIQGRSFKNLVCGGSYEPRTEVFLERNYHDFLDHVRAVRTKKYKYIRNFTERNRPMMPSDDPGEFRWNELRSSEYARAPEELYDLEKDPNEFDNVAGDPAYAATLAELRGGVAQWMNDTNDFLRGGHSYIHYPRREILFRHAALEEGGKAQAQQKPRKADR